jgi:hypothetical protein
VEAGKRLLTAAYAQWAVEDRNLLKALQDRRRPIDEGASCSGET